MFEIDTSTSFGARATSRLSEERVIWLVTVRQDGTPQPSPVWFYWDGSSILIYSQPDKPKLKNIEANPTVALHFDSDGRGGDIVIFRGKASILPGAPAADQVEAYKQKYTQGFQRIGMSAEQFAQTYSVAVQVQLTHLRGH